MRGVDLNVFTFDFDLTWAALFLHADGTVYGRYGGRDAVSPDTFLSLEGLRHALETALDAHRRGERRPRPPRPPERVEDYPATRRLSARACVHCHQVYDFRREARQAAGDWHLDEVWVQPLPENIGLTLDIARADCVRAVQPGSAADRAGLRPGDVLHEIIGVRVASVADVQHALDGAPASGEIPVSWRRARSSFRAHLRLQPGWRKTDISWRPSTRGIGPAPSVHGEDLTAAEKKALGLSEKRLAFRQEAFVTQTARQAGIRQNDIILGVDGQAPEMNARQFLVHVRLTYKVGDRIVWNILRNGRRLDLPMTLPERPPF